MLGLEYKIKPTKAWTGTVYIRADGSIDPPDAPMIIYYNVIYTLTDDIVSSGDGIVVERSNIIINGTKHTLTGSEAEYTSGIVLAGVNNVSVRNLQISRFYYGFWMNGAQNITLSGNNMTNNIFAVLLDYTFNSTISGNNMTNNNVGVLLDYSSTNTISGNSIAWSYTAIKLSSSFSNDISKNDITNNENGIQLDDSSQNDISKNKIIAIRTGHTGLFLSSSSNNNTISKNEIADNENGIRFSDSSYNIVSGNNITNNEYGIIFDSSFNNILSGNDIKANTNSMWFYAESSNNKIYHSNFIGNINPVITGGLHNIWDNGYPWGGNYWDNYNGVDIHSGPYQNENGMDAIGDSPFIMDGNNVDNYPLMGPFGSFNISLSYPINIISNSTIEELKYLKSNNTITLYVSNRTTDQTTGFCRLTIFHEILPPPYHIKINNNPTNYLTIFENETLSIIYFNYQHSELEIIIIQEFQSKTILLTSLIFGNLLLIFIKRQSEKRKHN